MARVVTPKATPGVKRRFVPPAPLRRVLVNFNRLGWRLGVAIAAVVLLTTIVTFIYAAYLLSDTLMGFTDSLDPTYRAELFKRFELYERRSSDSELNWTDFAFLSLPLVIPLSLGIVIALIVARLTARPLERIARAANAIATGDLEARVQLTPRQQRSDDEINQLAVHFNQMAESLQDLELERRETMAAIAHELRTPLMVLQARLEGVRDQVIPLSELEAVQLLSQVRTLTRLVEDLRTLSLADAGKLALYLEELDLLDVLSLSVAGFADRAEARGIALELSCTALILPVRGDRDRLAQVMANLLDNALRHTPDGGFITVTATLADGTVRTEVRDSGAGVPSDALPHLFERFYRADTSRSRDAGGSGLGLSIVGALVTLHAGQVTLANHPQGGAVVTIIIPVLEPQDADVS